jgi:2-polyprenyl-6-methoxyphenol hydroxylase-like FAD-dependent oxidoreductase
VQCGHRVKSFEEDGERVRVHLDTVHGKTERAVDVLVAADGIRSALRGQLAPKESDVLRFSGRVMWRGTVECEPFLDGRSMIMAGHFGKRVVVYPISKRHEDRGEALINWVAEVKNARTSRCRVRIGNILRNARRFWRCSPVTFSIFWMCRR